MRSRNVITQFYTTEGRNDNYQLTTNYHFLLPANKKKEYKWWLSGSNSNGSLRHIELKLKL